MERFIIPPFSILDTRQGYWQDRKRAWKEMGIRSEEGRDDGLIFRENVQARYHGINKSADVVKAIAVTTSIFDPVLCEISYKWFAPKGGHIYNPFAGGSVRGIVAESLGYHYTGIDLRQEQVDANNANAAEVGVAPRWICDDSQNVDSHIEDETMDMVFSCPPYFDLEKYSKDERDLSNMSWDDFSCVYRTIIEKAVAKLKPNRFAVFVVGEVRDKKGFYRDFVGMTKRFFEDAGAHLYNDMILVEEVGTGAMRANSQFKKKRKVVKVHQNVLVFYKGDTKHIYDILGDVDVAEIESE